MPLDLPDLVNILKRIHLFREIDDQRIETAAGLIEQRTYPSGTVIFQQDADPDYFYIIASGQVRLTCAPSRAHPTGQLGILDDEDYFGEEILESNWQRQVSAEAVGDTILMAISVEVFRQILEIIPELGQRLQLILDSYRLMLKTGFVWIEQDEAILFVARRHVIVLIQMILAPLLVGAVTIPILGFAFLSTRMVTVGSFLLLAVVGNLAWLVWQYVDWSNDYYAITNQRTVFQEKVVLIYDSRQESPLWAIQSTNIHWSQIGRIIGYGNVEVRTFYGNLLFRNIHMPTQVNAFIQQQQLRAQFRQRRLGIEDIKKYLDKRLKEGPEHPPLPQAKTPPAKTDAFRQFISNLLHLRYESGKTIIYRTNWFILLKKTFLPGSLMLGLILLFVISARSRFALLSIQATCGLIFLFGIIVFGWLAYQYMDWHNDLYLITPDQVVDVNKKPLGREDRLSAPIKNIQNIEFKRLGIIGRIFNFGTVYIRVGDRQLTFDDVYKPSDVQRELYHAMARIKAEESKRQTDERKIELGDWFDSYKQIS